MAKFFKKEIGVSKNAGSTITIGSTSISGGTTGSVLFIGASSVIQQDNANLFFDDTNNTLGVGTTRLGAISGTNPRLRVKGSGTGSGTSVFEAQDSGAGSLFLVRDDGLINLGSAGSFTNSSGQLALSTSGSGAGLLLGGDALLYRVSADVLRTPDSLIIDTNLTIGTTTGGEAKIVVRSTTDTSTDYNFISESSSGANLLTLAADGSFSFKNSSGGLVFQSKVVAGPANAFALGDGISLTNIGYTDSTIGASASMGSVGTGRIAIGFTANVADSSTGFYGIAIGQSANTLADGGLGVGFGTSITGAGQGSVVLGMNMRSSAISNVMLGTNYSFAQTNNIANSFMLQLGLATSASNFQDFFISGKSNVVLRNNTTLTAGTHYDTTAVNAYTVHNGTAPSGAIVDAFQMYSKDWNGAGTATAHFRNEENHTILLFKGAALTAQETTITFTEPGTPDYAIQAVTNVAPFGFVTANEANTFIGVVENLQVRVAQLEARLQASGQIT